jgi:hypothetical protein
MRPLPIGARYPLSPGYGGLFANFSGSLNITNASLAISGNFLSLQIGIDNRGAGNVTVFGVFLSEEQVRSNSGFADNGMWNAHAGEPAAAEAWQGDRLQQTGGNKQHGDNAGQMAGPYRQYGNNLSINESEVESILNSSGADYTRINLSQPVNNIFIFGHGRFGNGFPAAPTGNAPPVWEAGEGLSFMVSENGTLTLPNVLRYSSMNNGRQPPEPEGYVLVGGARAVFTYAGNLSFDGRPYPIAEGTNSTYRITVVTDRGVFGGNVTSR